jgi:hypothetical protein
MQLQKDIKGLVKGTFKLWSTHNGTHVVTRKWPTNLPFEHILMAGIWVIKPFTQNLTSLSRL